MHHRIFFKADQNVQSVISALSPNNLLLSRIGVCLPSDEKMKTIIHKDYILLTTYTAHLKIEEDIVTLSYININDIHMVNNIFKIIMFIVMLTTQFKVSVENDYPIGFNAKKVKILLFKIMDTHSERTVYLIKPCKRNMIYYELKKIMVHRQALMLSDAWTRDIFTRNNIYNYKRHVLIRTHINLNFIDGNRFLPEPIEKDSAEYNVNVLINKLLEQGDLILPEISKEEEDET